MGLRENKKYFETQFFNKWTQTPIHYAGQEFKNDGIESWINPIYYPRSGQHTGLSAFNAMQRGSFDVICWARNDADALGLSDDIIKFMIDNIDKDKFTLQGYQIQDHAWDDSGLTYVYLSFNVVSYDIKCEYTPPVIPTGAWTDGSGNTWTDGSGNTWTTN